MNTLNYHLSSDREDEVDVIFALDRLDDARSLSAVDFNPDGLVFDILEYVEDISGVEINGGQGPCIIKPIEGENYIYLILPIRR